MNQTTVVNGTRAVVINQASNGGFSWNLYVNCASVDGAIRLGDITLVRGKAKTLKGATKAAKKAVA